MFSAVRDVPAFGVSLIVHVVILVVLFLIPIALENTDLDLALETIFSDERVQEEFSQELEVETEVAVTMNTVSGGTVSTAVGAATGPPAAKVNITESQALKDPKLQVAIADVTMPGDSMLGQDLGEGEVTGDVGAVVEGYGAAMGRITQELIRMMRQQRVMVVWLFDESGSMKDDQEEIKQKFHKVYDELGIATKKDEKLRKGKEILLTMIASYGQATHKHLKDPTDNIEEIKKAIDNIPIDESGAENMCTAITGAINEYRTMCARQKRKLAIVLVSDESGDDGAAVEEAVTQAKRAQAPIYIMGRESIFGYLYAHQEWIDPVTKLRFWPRIRRGPETAYPECLQWDGLHARWDAHSAGFGPYEQVRLARESGGIYFVLPGEERELRGEGSTEQRQFDFLAMKEYQPLLLPRRTYLEERNRSEFRKAIWNVIVNLNPTKNELLLPEHDPQLNIRREHYPLDIAEFRAQAAQEVVKAARAMTLLNQAIPMLENVKPLRAREKSQRWRAAYDLAYAQLRCFRIRLFQYLLAMDRHANTNPKPEKEESNEWNVGYTRETIEPDENQFERLKDVFKIKQSREEYLAMVKDEEQAATELYQFVMTEHPGTPWARRANGDVQRGFGQRFWERFWDPKYRNHNVKVPKF